MRVSPSLALQERGIKGVSLPYLLSTTYYLLKKGLGAPYTLGKRLGCYQRLDDMRDENRRSYEESIVRKITNEYPDRLEDIFHQLREQVV